MIPGVAAKPRRQYFKAIVFCTNPLTGRYRFEDKFQIYPFVSDKAPKSDKVKIHPLVIEYWIDKVPDIEVPKEIEEMKEFILKHTHSNNYQKQILMLLSSLSNYRFFYPTPELKWYVELMDGAPKEEVDAQTSKAGLSYYYFPEMDKETYITEFTDTKLPDVKRMKHPDCFMHVDIEGNEEVQFSEHIDIAIHNYFALKDEAKEVINSAVSLICNGIDLRTNMKSLSFISFVSSIETMVNYEFRDEEVKRCDKCGTQMFRVMGKFRDYLFKYASDNPDTKKQINDIYNLRSKIVHTGLLFLGDNKIDWSDDKKRNEQWQTHLQVMQISRVSLTNWLLMRGAEAKQSS